MTDWRYKWVRTEIGSEPDTANVQKHLSRGWTPVPADQVPDHLISEAAPAGGLALYRMPGEDHDRLTAARMAEDVKAENWASNLPARIENLSHDNRSQIMARLEDFYNPTLCAENPKALGEANRLRRQLGLPERTVEQERKDALDYYAKRWPETTKWGAAQMRDYRIRFRMPKNLAEWAAIMLSDLRLLFPRRPA